MIKMTSLIKKIKNKRISYINHNSVSPKRKERGRKEKQRNDNSV